MGELTLRVGVEIDQPEVPGFDVFQIDETPAVAEKAVGAPHADCDLRHRYSGAVRSHPTEHVATAGAAEAGGIDNQVIGRRPGRTECVPGHEPHRRASVHRYREQAWTLRVSARCHDPGTVGRPVCSALARDALDLD